MTGPGALSCKVAHSTPTLKCHRKNKKLNVARGRQSIPPGGWATGLDNSGRLGAAMHRTVRSLVPIGLGVCVEMGSANQIVPWGNKGTSPAVHRGQGEVKRTNGKTVKANTVPDAPGEQISGDPLQFPLQYANTRFALACKCLKEWRALRDSNSRPSGS